ncbi:MAG: phasin family protein [Caldilinea sp.]
MKVDDLKSEAPTRQDVRRVQRQVTDSFAAASKTGRKLMRVYVGVWGSTYDRAADLYQDGVNLLEGAIRRGEEMEKAFSHRIAPVERRASQQFNTLQHRFGDNVEQVTRTVAGTSESIEGQLEKQVERMLVNFGIPTRDRLERLNQEIDRLNIKLDEELARQETVHA